MTIHELFQLAGGIILAVGYIPQIIQIIKTRSIRDLNRKTYIAICLGIGLMEIYAYNQWRQGLARMFFITNTVSLVMVCIILFLMLIFKDSGKEE